MAWGCLKTMRSIIALHVEVAGLLAYSYRFGELPLFAEISGCDCGKDFVNGCVGREGAVENAKLPLKTLRNVVSATTWVDHGGHQLDVSDVCEVTWTTNQ